MTGNLAARRSLQPTMRAVLGVVVALHVAASHADEVNLFPRRALEGIPPARNDRDLPIDSAWRAVERGVGVQFAPTAAAVTDESTPVLLARQVARRREAAVGRPSRVSEARGTPSGSRSDRLLEQARSREEQITAAQEAYAEPTEWRVVELEARVEADGSPGPVRVVTSSHRAALDDEAMRAVRRAIGAASGLTGPLVARFRFEAGVSVDVPARQLSHEVTTKPVGALVPLVRGRFGGDKPAEATPVFFRRVQTRVSLISLDR